jgi:hypothetical protein
VIGIKPFSLNPVAVSPTLTRWNVVMNRNHSIIEIAGELLHDTEKAYLFFDSSNEVWIPKSIGEWSEEDSTMQLPEWYAYEKGLI